MGACLSRTCAPLNWQADCKTSIVILPTAAAPDHNHLRAGRNGQRWFESLGASRVDVVPVVDKPSADNSDFAARVESARLIYLLGGFPRYLCETLRDSRVWLAALEAHRDGALIAGSSAGAMVLCEHYYDPYEGKLLQGLSLLGNICILPHHNRSGKNWASKLRSLIPQAIFLALMNKPESSMTLWTARGRYTARAE